MTNDLTKGSPAKLILKFMLPILVGNIFQQLYNMADMIIVGRTIGSKALAGVGATGAISFLIIGFVSGLAAGFSVMTSQCFGAKNENDVRRSVGTSVILAVCITIAMTAISLLSVKPLLKLMNTPEDIFEYSYSYINVIFWGLGATVFYNMISYIVRALGDSVTPLIFLIIASVINVGLDFWFIMGLKMGVAGAGIATVISQILSGIMCLVYSLIKFKILRLRACDFKTNWRWCWKHLRIGLPMAFQFSIIGIGVIVQQSALNRLGTTVVTAYSAANKIDNFATQTLASLGTALATYAGQNYGAGNYERIKKGTRVGMIYGVAFSALGCLIVTVFSRPLTILFMSDATAQILDYSREYLLYQGVFYIWLAAIFIYRNILQGMGRSLITVIAGVIELGMRIAACLVLIIPLGFTGVCLSNPLAWVGAGGFLIVCYYVIMRREKLRSKSRENLL